MGTETDQNRLQWVPKTDRNRVQLIWKRTSVGTRNGRLGYDRNGPGRLALSRFGPGLFRPGSFRPNLVVSAKFGRFSLIFSKSPWVR